MLIHHLQQLYQISLEALHYTTPGRL